MKFGRRKDDQRPIARVVNQVAQSRAPVAPRSQVRMAPGAPPPPDQMMQTAPMAQPITPAAPATPPAQSIVPPANPMQTAAPALYRGRKGPYAAG